MTVNNSDSAVRVVDYWRSTLGPYSEYYRDIGLTDIVSQDIPPAEIVQRVPITTKDDLVENLDRFVLKAHSPYAPAGWKDAGVAPYSPTDAGMMIREMEPGIADDDAFLREWLPIHFQRSGGSTGKSATTAYTWYDVFGPFKQSAEFIYRVTGVSRTGTVLNLLPAAPHLGIYATLILPLLIGQPNFNTFGGKVMATEEQVHLAGEIQPVALVGISSYIGIWARETAELVGAGDVAPLRSLKTVICVGEPVSRRYRERLDELFREAGAESVNVVEGMSSTEMRSAGFYECAPESGLHVDTDNFHVELLDPETHEPVPPGTPGVHVWSHIGWRGHALARYWSGDYIHGGMVREPCPHCGRTCPRLIGPITRYERDFVKVRGARVDLLSLFDSIRDVPGVKTFQVVLEKSDPDDPASRDLLKILLGTAQRDEELTHEVRDAVKRATEVTPDEIVIRGVKEVEEELFKRKLKAEQIVDLR